MDKRLWACMALGAVVVLAGCTVEEVDLMGRRTAKSAVTQVVAQNFPGVNAAPYTDCIIDNATANEVRSLAAGVLTGPDASITQMVLNIASRPETAQCIALSAFSARAG